MIYDNLVKNLNNKANIDNKVYFHFVRGAFLEIKGPKQSTYNVKFSDNKTGRVLYTTEISTNMWTKCSLEYFIEWKIEIYENGKLWFEHIYNAENKRVYVALDSKALGDSLAWIAYVEEFGKVHKCKMIASTFMNEMFSQTGANQDLAHAYLIPNRTKSWWMDRFGIHGTAQSKFWNNPTGWQDVVDWLNNKGYVVKLLSKEGDNYMGNKLPNGIVKHPNGPLELVMDEMKKSKAFIGIGSGLSWLSWALDVPTVLISGFSYDWAEMQDCIRIAAPKGKCEGCFNRLRLDAGDWNWCPDHKGTERQFECTKSITSEMVIKELEKFL